MSAVFLSEGSGVRHTRTKREGVVPSTSCRRTAATLHNAASFIQFVNEPARSCSLPAHKTLLGCAPPPKALHLALSA